MTSIHNRDLSSYSLLSARTRWVCCLFKVRASCLYCSILLLTGEDDGGGDRMTPRRLLSLLHFSDAFCSKPNFTVHHPGRVCLASRVTGMTQSGRTTSGRLSCYLLTGPLCPLQPSSTLFSLASGLLDASSPSLLAQTFQPS